MLVRTPKDSARIPNIFSQHFAASGRNDTIAVILTRETTVPAGVDTSRFAAGRLDTSGRGLAGARCPPARAAGCARRGGRTGRGQGERQATPGGTGRMMPGQ